MSVSDELALSGLPHPSVALHDGDFQTALQAFAVCEMLDYQQHGRSHSDIWVCGFGACLWLLGDTERAINTWTAACDEALRGKFRYSNSGLFGPGLLLSFASIWLGDADLREYANKLFDKLLNMRRPPMGHGEMPMLARLLRRETSLEELREQYRKTHPYDVQFRSASYLGFEREAFFYAGLLAFEEGNKNLTLELWENTTPIEEPSMCLDYHLMEFEKSRLKT